MTTNDKPAPPKAKRKTKPEALFILGMHRAGTSALTRCMSLMGYQLPKTLMGANKSNQKGHWESTRLARLNDRILDYFGMDWTSWLITVLQGEYDDDQPIVIKDPRISRILPLYISALKKGGYNAKFILASRNPIEVANSLKARNDMGMTESQMLWLRYNLDAEIATRGLARSFIDFGYLLNAPHKYLAGAIKSAKLRPLYSLEAIDNFLDKAQRHDSRSLEDVMLDDEHREWTGRVYQAWLIMCANPASKASLQSFDKVREDFDIAGPQLWRQLTALRAIESEKQRLWDKSHDKMTADVEILRQTISELKASAQKRDLDLSVMEREKRQTEKDLAKAFEDIDILKETVTQKKDRLALKEAEAQDAATTLQETKAKLSNTEKTLSKLAAESKTLRSEARQLNRDKWALQDRARFASDMVAALQQSTSWKVTKPLRFLKRLVSPQSVPPVISAQMPLPAAPNQTVQPVPPAVPTAVKPSKAISASDMAKVEASGLFDPVYYVSTYPDVQSQSLEPLAHYLTLGWQKGYQPSEKFNGQAYIAAHPNLKESGENPLLHFLAQANPDQRKNTDIKSVGRVAVFMAVAGPYDDIKNPDVISETADYFIFTDQEIPPNSVWQKREFEYFDADPTRMARFIKTHPHLYFADYDWALWVDANLQINVLPEDIIAPFHNSSPLATWIHPLRNCTYDEAKECEKRSKDDGQVMTLQMQRYRGADYPAQNGLYETSVMASQMGNPAIAKLMTEWWAEIEKGSRRDQLAFPYVVTQNGIDVAALAPKGICMRSDPRFNYYRHQR